jgi:hypothetical protein
MLHMGILMPLVGIFGNTYLNPNNVSKVELAETSVMASTQM